MEEDSYTFWAFSKENLTRIKLLRGAGEMPSSDDDVDAGINPMTGKPLPTPEEALEAYCVNLNEKAERDEINPLIGRDAELLRTMKILSRKTKCNPLYVGEPGVGKTAIAEGLALKIVNKDVPEYLLDAVIYALDLGLLIAGTRYRGEFEERLENVLKGLAVIGEDKKAILFIDEIHNIMGAGAAGSGSMDASNLLKPALASGVLKCIGSTTYKEYNKYFEKDGALKRRFGKIDVEEPSISDAKDILKGLAERYSAFHEVTYTVDALELAVDLSDRHIHNNRLPDKALDIIDEAGAAQRIALPENRLSVITVDTIEEVVAELARLPKGAASRDERVKLKGLKDGLLTTVFGQDMAIEELVDAVKVSAAGLNGKNKPIGSYLFGGPTGVGKTEMAKQLAKSLGIEFIRFDMSEYMERHTIGKLIGAPPGYVGHDDGEGLLIEAIDKHPHCVLLLDEIEKAHPDIYNLLLQVMDDGKLSGSHSKAVYFNNVILIMTTNSGSADAAKKAIGIGRDKNDGAAEESIKKLFSPEFRNRLDMIISFSPLDEKIMVLIVDKFLGETQELIADKKITINADNLAKEWLAKKGYSEEFGARPLSRVILKYIKKPMADEILYGDLQNGGVANITAVDGKLALSYVSI